MAAEVAGEAVVVIQRTFDAPIERVFEAWTDPKLMARWFCRAPGRPPTRVVEADVRPGGGYRVEVEEDRLYRGSGTYREVSPPTRLVFTWNWEHHDFSDALVTVELRSVDGATEIALTHERLITERDREDHRRGWEGCFDALARTLRGEVF